MVLSRDTRTLSLIFERNLEILVSKILSSPNKSTRFEARTSLATVDYLDFDFLPVNSKLSE